MNPQVPNELLSAYFDGEASPDERAAVESLLDESTATRRELDEISQLSALLHSFPRESAPAELVANVQRQTNQIPLVVQATVTPAVPARSLRREWTAAISAAVVTAAALFMMAGILDRTGARGLVTFEQSPPATLGLATDRFDSGRNRFMTPGVAEQADAPSSASAVASGLGGAGGGSRYAEGVRNGTAARSLAMEPAPKLAAPLAANAPIGDAASDAPIVANAGTEALFEARQNRALGVNMTLFDSGAVQNFYVNNSDFINGLKVGEVYQFVPQVADNGSNVAVVDLAVLDVERGVDQVQVLLSRNSIQPRMAGQSNDPERQKAQRLREQSKADGHEMVVVYTVGPGEQLAKTLEDMKQHPDLFFGWSSQPPVQLPSGDELVALKEDATSGKDATVPAEKPSADKSGTAKQNADRQLTARRKEATAVDDAMDDEAELALNALLVRNTYANNGALNYGTANFNDSNTANFGGKNLPQGVTGDAKSFSRAGAAPEAPAPAPSTAATQPAKSLSVDPKNGSPSTARSRSLANEAGKGDPTAKKSGDQKQDADVRLEFERRSYQTTFRVPTDGIQLAEQVPQLNRSNTPGLDNTFNKMRRSSSNVMLQQTEANGRAATNSQSEANRVKVLFVLHPMPAPTAAPATKPNP